MQVGQFRQTKHERNLVDKSHNVWSLMVDFPVSPHLLYRKKVIVLRILEVHDQGILGDRLPAGKLYGNRDPITDVSAFLFIDLDEGLCGEMGLHLPDRLIHLQGIDPGIQTLECFPEGGLQEQFMIVASAKRATCPQDFFDKSKLHCSAEFILQEISSCVIGYCKGIGLHFYLPGHQLRLKAITSFGSFFGSLVHNSFVST